MKKDGATVGPWQVTSSSDIYDNPWISVTDHQVIHPDGSPGQYGVVHFKSRGVGVLPLNEAGEVYMVGQHRFPLDTYSWEIPEGGCPVSESPIETAKRELAEETGLTATNWLPLFENISLSNSVSDERGWGFLAWGLDLGTSMPEPSEELVVETWPFQTLLQRVLSGEVHDGITHIIVLTALAKAQRGDLPADVSQLILGHPTG